MAYSKEIPAYPDIEYLLLTCFCPLRTTAIGRKRPGQSRNYQSARRGPCPRGQDSFW